mgnify:FL=1
MKYSQKILIIEDEIVMRKTLVDNLRASGFENILIAGDGEQGLQTALGEKPDLILLDIGEKAQK